MERITAVCQTSYSVVLAKSIKTKQGRGTAPPPSTYHEVSVGRQQTRPVPAAQSAHGAVVRVRGADEVVHVAVGGGHTRRRSHRVAPQHVDGIVQALQAVLDATLLWSAGTQNQVSLLRHLNCHSETQVGQNPCPSIWDTRISVVFT